MIAALLLATLPLAGVPDAVRPSVKNQIDLAAAGEVHLGGFLGERFERNRNGRLKHVPMDILLGGFKSRPGSHPWIGEHIGKWMHAASLTYQESGDADLKAMLDAAVRDLLATEKPDGYLGTYGDKDRWTSWDVWVHKYNLIGLLAYWHATGNESALKGAKGIGDLLAATFGPGKRDIIAAGTHVGMAATSVLEPMVGLYRATGDEKYLAFCQYLVTSWDQPKGPKILSSLLDHGKVNRTANAKAYEMMSNLVGLCDLYRVTGDERYLRACQAAWNDIAAHQLYVTGGTSLGEHFQPDGYTPERGAIAETCANVTWLQLTMRLFEITGEATYADMLERIVYNHLLSAQRPDGEEWCYFTVLAGKKVVSEGVNCCHSSGPRGVAMIPSLCYGYTADGLRVNFYGPSTCRTKLADGTRVEVEQQTDFPATGRVVLAVKPDKPAEFTLALRVPEWSKGVVAKVNGQAAEGPAKDGLLAIDREWKAGDQVEMSIDMTPRWIHGTGDLAGKLAAARGPFVLCVVAQRNGIGIPDLVGVQEGAPFSAPGEMHGGTPEEKAYSANTEAFELAPDGMKARPIVLTPWVFVQNEEFTVWIRSLDMLRRIK